MQCCMRHACLKELAYLVENYCLRVPSLRAVACLDINNFVVTHTNTKYCTLHPHGQGQLSSNTIDAILYPSGRLYYISKPHPHNIKMGHTIIH